MNVSIGIMLGKIGAFSDSDEENRYIHMRKFVSLKTLLKKVSP